MAKPAEILDSKPHCELMLIVAFNPNSSIQELVEKTGKKRTTLVEQLNRLNKKKIVKKNMNEKQYTYSVNYDAIANLFFEILKEECELCEEDYKKKKFFEYGVVKYLEEAFLSLRKSKPETTIRQLLKELLKTTAIDKVNTETSSTVMRSGEKNQVTQRVVLKNKRYQNLQTLLLSAYYSMISPKFKGGIFEEFRKSLEKSEENK